MAEEKKSSGVTEASIVLSVLAFLEPAASYVAGHPILPDPWSQLVLGVLGVTIYFLRRAAKKREA